MAAGIALLTKQLIINPSDYLTKIKTTPIDSQINNANGQNRRLGESQTPTNTNSLTSNGGATQIKYKHNKLERIDDGDEHLETYV